VSTLHPVGRSREQAGPPGPTSQFG